MMRDTAALLERAPRHLDIDANNDAAMYPRDLPVWRPGADGMYQHRAKHLGDPR